MLPDSRNDELLLALRQLKDGEREALMLVYWEQLSYAEAGQVLGCSANAVAIRMHRAKTRLREVLAAPREPRSPGTVEAIVSFKTHGS
jgi:RNA polymerase sigma-70 factor (ECF subfamily)